MRAIASGSVAAARAASAAAASDFGRVSVISIWICSATRDASPARQTCQPMKTTMTATRIASSRAEHPSPDPQPGHERAEARLRRRVGEAAFLERLDALVEDAVGDLEALALVDLAQALLQRLVAHVLAEFLLDQASSWRSVSTTSIASIKSSSFWAGAAGAGAAATVSAIGYERVPFRGELGHAAACHPRPPRGSPRSSWWRASASP